MSWKSIVTAGVLCVVASPVFAVPQLSVSNGGLNASGQYVWNVMITPTGTTSPVAAELGFRETTAGSQLVGATKGASFTGADTDNPGTKIFTWETEIDVDPSPTVTNMRPVGLQTNATNDEVFAALGSIADLTGATEYITITTKGPTTAAPTSTLQVLGKYGTGLVNGRIAEITSGTNATNYSNFAGSATRTAFPGDVNMSGNVNFADVLAFSPNFNKATTNGWAAGDFDGNGTVQFADVLAMSPNFNKTGGVNTPLTVNGIAGGAGAGLGSGSSVPEPASVAIAGLAMLAALGFTMRKRQK